jgi:general secretion pathway protein F
MPIYAYKGVNAKDKKVSGIVDADSPKTARLKLRKMEVYPLSLEETVEKVSSKSRIAQALKLGGGVSALELAGATRQLSTLVGAQLPLVQCLTALAEQVDDHRFRTVLAEIKEGVNEGSSLADAMAAYPRIFTDLYVNMIRAGEQSGALDVVLDRLADFTETQADLRNKILYAMLYPVIIIVIMTLVIGVMFIYVIPKITMLFQQTKQTLPPLTVAMIALSNFARGWWWLIVALAAASFFAVRYYIRTPAGRERWDRFVLKVPVIGRISLNVNISRFCKTLSTLLMSGIPILRAMDIVEKVVGNRVLGAAIGNARANITEGASIADPLRQSRVFPPFVIQMIASGEASGELEFMLQKASDSFDREVENAVNGLTKLIEPIMILVLAGMVVLVILSFLLPIINLTSGIG